MRRLLPLFVMLMLFAALPAAAQDVTPVPATPDALVAQAQAAAARSEMFAQDAQRYAQDASNYVGIFESVGIAIGVLTGLVVPLLAIIAGFVGLTRLNEARRELTEARQRVERELESVREGVYTELRERQAELDALSRELKDTAAYERRRSEQATLALSLLPLGERQYRVKDIEGALRTYERALKLDPDNVVVHYRLGYVFTNQGRLDEANDHLTRALEVEPNFAPALANLGYVIRLRAEKLPPDAVERGAMLADAEQKMRQALTIMPMLVDEDGESWWGSLGGLHRRRGQIDDAIKAYNRALDVTPQSSYPLGNLALLYMQNNDLEKMRDTYRRVEVLAARRAASDMPDFWAFADLLVAQLALGKFTEAETTLDALLAAVPMSAPEMLNNPLNTLRQLVRMTNQRDAAQLQTFIQHMERFIGNANRRPTA